MEWIRVNELSRISLGHVGCTWLGVQRRSRFEIPNDTRRKKQGDVFSDPWPRCCRIVIKVGDS